MRKNVRAKIALKFNFMTRCQMHGVKYFVNLAQKI